jgi:hypothetical protein
MEAASGTNALPGMPGKDAPGGAPGIDMPGGDPGLDAPGGDAPEKFQRSVEAIRYERERKALLAEVAKVRQEALLVRYERDLERLLAQGYELDLREELGECRTMTPEQFSRHKQRIVRRYSRSPVGGPVVPVLEDTPDGPEGREGVISEALQEKALTHMRQKGCSWDEALTYARNGNGKK